MAEEVAVEVVEEKLNIYQRQVQAMLALKSIPKNGYNSYSKYQYATDGDVLDTMRVLLAEHGIGWTVGVTSHEWNEAKNRTIVELKIELVNMDNPEDYICVPWIGEANDKTDKGVVKAITSGVKYFLLKSFLATAGNEDDDSDAGHGERGTLATVNQKGDIRTLMHDAGINGDRAVDDALKAAGFPKLALVTSLQVAEISERLKKAAKSE